MRIPGTTPSAPDDTGACDPALAGALESGDRASVLVAMLRARLLVPVLATSGTSAEAEMAVPALVSADGRSALPVFSSYQALRAWREDARPVPMRGCRVFAGAAAEGYDGVLLDVAGPAQITVEGADLAALAAAGAALVEHPDAPISVVF